MSRWTSRAASTGSGSRRTAAPASTCCCRRCTSGSAPTSAVALLRIPPRAGRARARLFEAGAVLRPAHRSTTAWLEVEVSLRRQDLERICREDGTRSAGGMRALCRRGPVPTIHRAPGCRGCGMNDRHLPQPPAPRPTATRHPKHPEHPYPWPGTTQAGIAIPGAIAPTRARPTSTRPCATCNANCPRCSAARRRRRQWPRRRPWRRRRRQRGDARLRLQHRGARAARHLGADGVLRGRRRRARRRDALRRVRGDDRAGPALAHPVADRGAADRQRRVDRGRSATRPAC